MPTLDPPHLEWGDHHPTHRRRRGPKWHPATTGLVTFMVAMVTTVLVVVLAGALGN